MPGNLLNVVVGDAESVEIDIGWSGNTAGDCDGGTVSVQYVSDVLLTAALRIIIGQCAFGVLTGKW
jgi:hypothetical protein